MIFVVKSVSICVVFLSTFPTGDIEEFPCVCRYAFTGTDASKLCLLIFKNIDAHVKNSEFNFTPVRKKL